MQERNIELRSSSDYEKNEEKQLVWYDIPYENV